MRGEGGNTVPSTTEQGKSSRERGSTIKRKTNPSQAGPNRHAANREPGRWTGMKLNGCLALLGDQGHLHGIVSNYPSGLDRGFLYIEMGVMTYGCGRMWTRSSFLVSSE